MFQSAESRFRRPSVRGTSRDDAVRSLRIFAREQGPPLTCNRYDGWAFRQREATDRADGVSVPSSASIARRFSGWRPAIFAVCGPEFPVARARSREYADEELARAWSEFLTFANEQVSERNWARFRETTRDPDGSCRVPSGATLARWLGGGSWRGCLQPFWFCTSLPPDGRLRRWTDDELIRCWRECTRDLGAAPESANQYDKWRESCRRQGRKELPPGSTTFVSRWGPWRDIYARFEGRAPGRFQAAPGQYSMAEIKAAWDGGRYRSVRHRPCPSARGVGMWLTETLELAPTVQAVQTLLARFGSWRGVHRAAGRTRATGARQMERC